MYSGKYYGERSEAKNFLGQKSPWIYNYYLKKCYFGEIQKNSLCLQKIPCVKAKFPVFSLSGKVDSQIPCFPCAVATLNVIQLIKKVSP